MCNTGKNTIYNYIFTIGYITFNIYYLNMIYITIIYDECISGEVQGAVRGRRRCGLVWGQEGFSKEEVFI